LSRVRHEVISEMIFRLFTCAKRHLADTNKT